MTGPGAQDQELDDLVHRLTLQEKVHVLTGSSAWATAALPSIGLRSMVLSDGPSGVRGATWDERDPSLCLPSATALSSSWDVDLAARYGAVAAGEARRKGVDVVLGPTVNLHRSPLAGRQFEAFSEDPLLTADLAAAYVRGVQERGVAATIKHYVANDSETDRYTTDVRVEDRPLRELYLAAFERAVREAGSWCVMSAYNAVNGATMTENELLTDPLTTSWGFDGVVVSDWTAVRDLASARHPQHLAMPGPDGPWGETLVQAVLEGQVAEHLIDDKVRRILRLARRVGALGSHRARPVGQVEDGAHFAREAAAEGMVLVRNDGLLPVDDSAPLRVAVIGEHAARPRIQGGGSATVIPHRVVSPLEGLRQALGDAAVVEHEMGCRVQEGFVPLAPEQMTNPATGEPGGRITYLAADGTEIYGEDRLAAFILDFAPRPVDRLRTSLTFVTTYTPVSTGTERFGFASPGRGRLLVDGDLVLDAEVQEVSDQVQAFFSPPHVSAPVEVVAGRPVTLRYEFTPGSVVDGVPGSVSVTFGTELPVPTEADHRALRERAVALARTADVVVVVVGTTEQVECEGYDRDSLRLPGRQDDLVHAVVAANPRTAVVVNAGAAVEMPWREEAAAVLLSWFGGQEYGLALADVLTGRREPGGRLPTTWPSRLDDAPVNDVGPDAGVLRYDEGIHIGYRAWLRTETAPALPFGFGLGYTSWSSGTPRMQRTSSGFAVGVAVTNTGDRFGKQVVQVYTRQPGAQQDRPALWLVGFAVVRADPGQTVEAVVTVPERALAYWADGWWIAGGRHELLVGSSVMELTHSLDVVLEQHRLTELDRYPGPAAAEPPARPPVPVVVVGSVNEDLTLRVHRRPAAGETVLAAGSGTAAGGKGLNQAVAAAGAIRAGLVAAIGDDASGRALRAVVEQRHDIDLAGLTTTDQPTGRAVITVDAEGENSIVVAPGANSTLDAHHVRRALDELRPTVVVTQLEIPVAAATAARDWAHDHGARFVLNCSPFRDDALHLLDTADPVIVNAAEAQQITGSAAETADIAARLQLLAVTAVVTAGGEGAYLADGQSVTHVSAYPVAVVDTTGAGDAFAGALAAAIATSAPLQEAVQAAVQEASRVVRLERAAR